MDWHNLIDLKNSPHLNFLQSKGSFWEAIVDLENYIDEFFKNPPAEFSKNNNLLLGRGVKIAKTATILGKAVIGANSEVKDSVLLRDGVVIGENCIIGHASEVKHSMILDSSNIAHLNYVGDSLIGSKVNIAAGVIVANVKSGARNSEVFVEVSGEKVATGLQKLGALVGDGTKIGSNCVLDPGVILGKNIITYPLTPIRGTFPSNKIIKYKPNLEIVDKE